MFVLDTTTSTTTTQIGLGVIGSGHNDDDQNKLAMELKWIEQKLLGANNDLLFTDPNKVHWLFVQFAARFAFSTPSNLNKIEYF